MVQGRRLSTMGPTRVLYCAIVLCTMVSQLATAVRVGLGKSNLVLNPSFETAGGHPAAHWTCPAQYSRVTDVVHAPAVAALQQCNMDPTNYQTCKQTVMGAQPGRWYNASAWVKSVNITGDGTGATICVEYSDDKGYLGGIYPLGVTGTTDWTQISDVAYVPETAVSVHISVYTRKGMTGTAWFDQVSFIQLGGWANMRTTLLSPIYRGRITSAPPSKGGCDSIKVKVHLDYTSYDHTSSDLEVLATLSPVSDSNAEPIELLKVTGVSEIKPELTLVFKTKPASLSVGNYTVNCTLRNITSGHVLNTSAHSVERVTDESTSPTTWLDEDQRLIHKGKPLFPIGLYLSEVNPTDLSTIGQSKFNMIMPYRAPANLSIMDGIHKAGLHVMFSTKDSYFGGPNKYKTVITSREKEEEFVKEQVSRFKDHPALLGWYLNDELNIEWMADLEAHYQWTRDTDPDHPAWSVLRPRAGFLAQYMATFDVIGTDPYPINAPYNASSTNGQAARVGQEVDISLAGIDNARPLWEVIQAHNLRDYHKGCTGCRTPSAKEERSMAWQAICRGANGIVYYSFFDIKRNDDVSFETEWGILSTVAAEIDKFAPVLLSDEGAAPAPTLAQAGARRQMKPGETGNASENPSWLAARARWMASAAAGSSQSGDDYYIFVANDGNGGGKVTFTIDRSVEVISAAGVQVVSVSPPRKIDFDGSGTGGTMRFSDTVDPLDVVVYKINTRKGTLAISKTISHSSC